MIDNLLGDRLLVFKYAWLVFMIGLLGINIYIFVLINFRSQSMTHYHAKWIYPMTNRHSARNFFISLNYFTFGILPQKYLSSGTNYNVLKKPKLLNNDINRTVILVIGESLRADKFRLDDNNTLTPNLQELKNKGLVSSKSIYSGGTITKVSIATLINRLKYPRSSLQITQEDNCLFRLAKENKFHTYFISRQGGKKLEIVRDIMCPKYIDKFIDKDDFGNYITPVGYDEDLATVLDRLNILNVKSFIVLHHRGSHSPYSLQYPSSFDIGSSYDNTVRYTDYSLSQLIDFVQHNANHETFLIYVSDHGELLGENGKHGHGTFEKEVYTVPALMYTNTKNKALKKQFNNIKSQYDIANYITSLLGYKSDALDKDKEIYILNSDLDGYSGYGIIQIQNGIESNLTFHHDTISSD